jgi:hypothetical protein
VPRTVLVGDVHGCADELGDLLDLVGVGTDDRVVLLGDLVGRGPEPRRVIELVRAVRARAVRGNHEDRLLRWRATPRAEPLSRSLRPLVTDPSQRLGVEDWELLASLPLWLELPEHGILVVHAGLQPGLPLAEQPRQVLLHIRSLRPNGKADARRGRELWGKSYQGPPHVVFGHNADREPQLHPWATGLDTGCVYGGRLTALVLPLGEPVPPLERRGEAMISVPARQIYVPIDD